MLSSLRDLATFGGGEGRQSMEGFLFRLDDVEEDGDGGIGGGGGNGRFCFASVAGTTTFARLVGGDTKWE